MLLCIWKWLISSLEVQVKTFTTKKITPSNADSFHIHRSPSLLLMPKRQPPKTYPKKVVNPPRLVKGVIVDDPDEHAFRLVRPLGDISFLILCSQRAPKIRFCTMAATLSRLDRRII
jgi:hypothetical protein